MREDSSFQSERPESMITLNRPDLDTVMVKFDIYITLAEGFFSLWENGMKQ